MRCFTRIVLYTELDSLGHKLVKIVVKTGSWSAFEKWSGHVVPKCCRKGEGGWAMTLKDKDY